ncbi:MAG: GerMN domain-containing protein [Patescibacteria group bacterium]|jgi:hypothetical protein
MTEEEKTQSALPLDGQPDNQEQAIAPVDDTVVSVAESAPLETMAETEEIKAEETGGAIAEKSVAEESNKPIETIDEAVTTEIASAMENEASTSKAEIKPEAETTPVAKSNEPVKEPDEVKEKPEVEMEKQPERIEKEGIIKSDRPQPKTIAAAVIALLIVIAVIWLIVSNMSQGQVAEGDGSVRVSTTLEDGKVSIIEEVPEEIKVNVTSDDVPVWPTTKVIAYYSNTVKNANSSDCSKVEPLEREIDDKFDSNIVNTVIGLLQPLSSADKAAGYYSAIPLGTRLKYVKLDDDGTLEVNFDSQLDKAAGSCAVTAIRSQITNTLMQFAQVQSVKICIDGNCQQDQILQP